MRRTSRAGTVVASMSLLALTACAGGDEGTPTLSWYTNPDAGGQAAIAASCTEAADGAYRIETVSLPREAASQREQLARRLAAKDASIDLMSLDPPYIPELAEAGFLAPIPDDKVEVLSEGVLEGALAGASWRDELVTAPFWANTQLLWYRVSVAEAAGLDMESGGVTWEQLIDAAAEQDKLLAVQGTKAESFMVWVNALVASAGGQIVTDPAADSETLQLGLDSEAGRAAAEIVGRIGSEGLGGPGMATADENANLSTFQSDSGSFMVNWPFVWPATLSAVEGGTLEESLVEDIGWALYPRVTQDAEPAPPLGGINLGVGAFSEHTDLAYDAVECIVAPENQVEYFISDGNPPSNEQAYDDERLTEEFPMAETIRESLELAVPRPQTPYYNELSIGLQETWYPASSVDPETTPVEATDKILSVLRGEALL